MITIFTEAEICPRARDWPLEKIGLGDMRDIFHIRALSGTVIVHKGDEFKVIKNRGGECDGTIRDLAAFYRFIENHNRNLLREIG